MDQRQSVLQLARKYGVMAAKKENEVHRQLRTPTNGKENLRTVPKEAIKATTTTIKMSTRTVIKPMNPVEIKEALLRWVQAVVAGYQNVNVTNFSSSWADGMAFCAVIHRFAPNAFDFQQLNPKNRRGNFELAFKVAEENGIYPLLEVDDMIMMGDRPDWKCVFTYVQAFYQRFRATPIK